MSESEETAAAAAAGAAAAVNEVQDQQAQEEAAERSEAAAAVAAGTAVEAHETATEAVSTSTVAASMAAESQETAQQAADVAGAVAQDQQTVHSRIDQLQEKQEAFFTEARDFFHRLEERKEPSDDVTHVEVTHGGNTGEGTDRGSQGTPGNERSTGDGGKSRRHRFGQ